MIVVEEMESYEHHCGIYNYIGVVQIIQNVSNTNVIFKHIHVNIHAETIQKYL